MKLKETIKKLSISVSLMFLLVTGSPSLFADKAPLPPDPSCHASTWHDLSANPKATTACPDNWRKAYGACTSQMQNQQEHLLSYQHAVNIQARLNNNLEQFGMTRSYVRNSTDPDKKSGLTFSGFTSSKYDSPNELPGALDKVEKNYTTKEMDIYNPSRWKDLSFTEDNYNVTCTALVTGDGQSAYKLNITPNPQKNAKGRLRGSLYIDASTGAPLELDATPVELDFGIHKMDFFLNYQQIQNGSHKYNFPKEYCIPDLEAILHKGFLLVDYTPPTAIVDDGGSNGSTITTNHGHSAAP